MEDILSPYPGSGDFDFLLEVNNLLKPPRENAWAFEEK
jgi:hypothetical protein